MKGHRGGEKPFLLLLFRHTLGCLKTAIRSWLLYTTHAYHKAP